MRCHSPTPKHLLRVGACAGALLGTSFVSAWAGEKPTAPAIPVPPPLTQTKPVGVTSLTLSFPTSSPGDAQKLLDAPVSFDINNASFLVALDAVVTASGKTCRIECRAVQPMKMTFSAINEKAGDLLHSLALAGGCDLYVLPDKLVICPPSLLLDSEKTKAHPFQVLLPLNSASGNNAYAEGINKTLRALHTHLNVSFDNKEVGEAIGDLCDKLKFQGVGYEYSSSFSHIAAGFKFTFASLSTNDITLGEALNAIAHPAGCDVYVLPGAIKICGPEVKGLKPAFVQPSELPSLVPPA